MVSNSVTATPKFFYNKEGGKCLVCKRSLSKKDVNLLWRAPGLIGDISASCIYGVHKMCLTCLINNEDTMEDEYDKIVKRVKIEGKLF